MIATLQAKVIKIKENSIIAENGGVGYELNCCPCSISKLKKGDEFFFYISSSFSMYEGQSLYGFLSEEEKEIFELFRQHVPKTGAKKALEYLNKAIKSISEFKKAASCKDIKTLTAIFGFTKKTAEKLAESLKDKLAFYGEEISPSISGQNYEKLLNALISLGYTASECKQPVKDVLSSNDLSDANFETLFKQALKRLSRGL